MNIEALELPDWKPKTIQLPRKWIEYLNYKPRSYWIIARCLLLRNIKMSYTRASQRLICEATGYTRQQVYKVLTDLKANGYIETVPDHHWARWHNGTKYRLNIN